MCYKNKKVICITTNEQFDSMIEAEKKLSINSTGISSCCKGKVKSAGKSETGEPMVWMYYEDYLKKTAWGNIITPLKYNL